MFSGTPCSKSPPGSHLIDVELTVTEVTTTEWASEADIRRFPDDPVLPAIRGDEAYEVTPTAR